MNKIKISVIIPIYNTEKYLIQCLDSIVNQSLTEIEIICVNDGSTDSSLQILEEYSNKDERIKIINKKNEGAGKARKTGLDSANGDFIAFIDSDDWIKLDAYERLYQNAISNDSEVVILNMIRYDEHIPEFIYWDSYDIAAYFNNKNINFNDFVFKYNDIKPYLLNKYFAPWTKLYKTEFLRKHKDFFFPKNIIAVEDIPLHVQVLLRANKISFCPDKLYFYRISNIDSTSNSSCNSKNVFDIFTVVDEVEDILNENKKMNEFEYEFFIFKVVQLIQWFEKCDKIFENEFFKRIKESFERMNLKEIGTGLNYNHINKYKNILNSNSPREYELLEKINQLEITHNKKLKLQEKEYQEKLNVQKKEFEEKIITQSQILQEMINSKSWKLTKPLRIVGRIKKSG